MGGNNKTLGRATHITPMLKITVTCIKIAIGFKKSLMYMAIHLNSWYERTGHLDLLKALR
jgi:hypothetical protein